MRCGNSCVARLLVGVLVLFLGLNGQTASQGLSIADPGSIAGRWETSDGQGGAAGMNILLTTEVSGGQASFSPLRQVEQQLVVGLFQRTAADVTQLGFNFFTSSAEGGAKWDGHRLRIQLSGNSSTPGTNVDLVWNADTDSWSGRFARGQFRSDVVLKRPMAAKTKSPFAGTWLSGGGGMNNCLHIAGQEGSTLTAWADDIQVPRRSESVRPLTLERYGEIAKVQFAPPNWITVELRAYTAGCCPHTFTAKVSPDGQRLSGDWHEGPNQSVGPTLWKKVPGESCVGAGGLDLR
jgi:hypothetical protein